MRGLHFDSYAEFELFSYIIICSESWNTSNQNSVSLFLSYFELKSKTFNKSNLFTFLLISLFLFDPCCFMRPASKAWSKTNWEIGEKKKQKWNYCWSTNCLFSPCVNSFHIFIIIPACKYCSLSLQHSHLDISDGILTTTSTNHFGHYICKHQSASLNAIRRVKIPMLDRLGKALRF